jgi:SagB-type dehydrogenase family enzyme
VESLEFGLYRYLPLEHKLLWIGRKEKDDLTKALNCQDFGPAATFIWTVVPYRIEWRYTIAAQKLALLDAGHVCENLYLACEAEGMGTCAIGAYLQKEMDEFLEVDGENEFAIYAAPVGMKKGK